MDADFPRSPRKAPEGQKVPPAAVQVPPAAGAPAGLSGVGLRVAANRQLKSAEACEGTEDGARDRATSEPSPSRARKLGRALARLPSLLLRAPSSPSKAAAPAAPPIEAQPAPVDEVPPGHPLAAAAGASVSEVYSWAVQVRRRHATAHPNGAAPAAPGGPAWTLEGWLRSGAAVTELALALARHLRADADASLQLAFARAVPELSGPQAVLALLQSSGAMDALADVIWREGEALRQAAAASGAELHSKFLLQPNNITLSYAKLDVFFAGLEGLIGSPDANLEEAMRREHTEAADSLEPFTTGNYQVTTTSKCEWAFVRSPDTGLAELGLPAWPAETVLPHGRADLCRQPHPLADFDAEFDRVNQQLIDIGQPVLTSAEELGLRLYTGPMFEKYNTALRGGARSIEQSAEQAEFMRRKFAQLCKGNRYQTTIHVINSGLVKLGKIQQARTVFRGVSRSLLPDKFWQPNAFGVCGGVEYGFMSTTTDRDVAMQYASNGGAGMLFEMRMGMVDRGADISWISQYPHEREICFAPLTGLERLAERVENDVLVVEFRLSINLVALTIEQVVAKRHKTMVELALGQDVETNKAVEDGPAWAPFRELCGTHWEAVRQELRRASSQDFAKITEGKVEAMNNDDEMILTVQQVVATTRRWAGPHLEALERAVAALEPTDALAAQQVRALRELVDMRTADDVVDRAVGLLPGPPAPLPGDLGAWPHKLDLLLSAAAHSADLRQGEDAEEVKKVAALLEAIGRYRKVPGQGAQEYEACVVDICRAAKDEASCCVWLRLLAACVGSSISMPALLELALEAVPWKWHVDDITDEKGSDTPTDAASFVVPAPTRELAVSFRWKDQGWGNWKGRLLLELRRGGQPLAAMGLPATDSLAPHDWVEVYMLYDGDSTPLVADIQTGDTLVLQYVAGGGGGHALYVTDFCVVAAPSAGPVDQMMRLSHRTRDISRQSYTQEVLVLLASTPPEAPSWCHKWLGFLAACCSRWSAEEHQLLKVDLSDVAVVADLVARIHAYKAAARKGTTARLLEALEAAEGLQDETQTAAALEAWLLAASAWAGEDAGRSRSSFCHAIWHVYEPDKLIRQTKNALDRMMGDTNISDCLLGLRLLAAAAKLWQVPLPRFLERDVLQSPDAVAELRWAHMQNFGSSDTCIDRGKMGIVFADGARGNPVMAGAQLSLVLTVSPDIRKLDLAGIDTCGVGGATAVAEALVVGTHNIFELAMSRCGLGPQGVQVLAQVLARDKKLVHLGVAGNDMGDAGAAFLADALEGNRTLLVISVAKNGIGPRGGRALAAALQKNTTLENLGLDDNALGAAEPGVQGVPRFAEVLEQAVQTRATPLNVWANRCELRDEELDSLEVALKQHGGSLICTR